MAISTLTGGPAAKVRDISIAALVEAYLRDHGVNVSPYLPKVEKLSLWRCEQSGLEFFDRNGLAGPPVFYEALYSKHGSVDWAYQQDKWEFRTAATLLSSARRPLDVGCGGGDFLAILKRYGVQCLGLETSAYGRAKCIEKGVAAVDDVITRYAGSGARHDAVTAFQVLEHVETPRVFLTALTEVLEPHGTLVLSVPNNDSFLKDCPLLTLNLPPHHVTMWGREALEFLPEILPLEIIRIEKEPLQSGNLGWYQSAMELKHLPQSRLARWLWRRTGGSSFFRRVLESQRETIDGHTILAVYRKRPT